MTDAANEEARYRQRIDFLECSQSPVTFAERHIQIERPRGEVIPFHLWSFQHKTLQAFHQNNAVIVLKARRLGLSWLALMYALWLALFSPGLRSLILCKNEEDAIQLLARVRRMRNRLASDPASQHLFRDASHWQPAAKRLEIGPSVIRALPATEAAARSETAGLVVLDEFAFGPEASGTWRAAFPTVEGGGQLLTISTGNKQVGLGQEFFRQWDSAFKGESGIAPLFWPWDAHPARDQDWYDRTLAELGDETRMAVEYPSQPSDAFLQSDAVQVYDIAGVGAAERLGREYDELWESGELPSPEHLALGIDFGEQTHCLVIFPLEGGGVWIPDEVVSSHTDAEAEAPKHIQAASKYGRLWQMRFDAAGVQSRRAWRKAAPERLRTRAVPFNKYKQEVMGYLRQLFHRTAQGKETRIIAISPRCEVLLRQLRQLEFKDPDQGLVVKMDDHGPDALVAGCELISTVARNRARRNLEEDDE